MQNDPFTFIQNAVEKIPEPDNLFSGKRLPQGFALPDNILVFFHDFTAASPNAHGRHTLVIPFDRMTYFVERRKIPLQPGFMLYVPPFALRFLHPGSCGFRRLFITFELPVPQPYLPEPGVFNLTPAIWQLLQKFLDKYIHHTPEETSFALMDFLKAQKPVAYDGAANHLLPENLVQVTALIEENLSSVTGIKFLADKVGISESHLRTLFRKNMGISIGNFIKEKRIDYAKYKLLNSDIPIGRIARECGFSNVFVFGTFFKRNAGIPPLCFRKSEKFHKNPNQTKPNKTKQNQQKEKKCLISN